jgi:hypothetical protein
MQGKLASILLGTVLVATAVAASLLAAGCSGELGAPADDTADLIRNPIRPAPAYIEWQFDSCLTPDQRIGLPQALQQVHAQTLPEITPSVAFSSCDSDGQERGGLFPYGTSQASAELTRAAIAIRVVQRHYAFAITGRALAVIAAKDWAQVSPSLVLRWNDSGAADPNGRYQIAGNQVVVSQGPWFVEADTLVHVVDHQTQLTVDIDWQGFVTTHWPGGGQLTATEHAPTLSPASSTDPFEQTLINSVSSWITVHAQALDKFLPVQKAGNGALDFSLAPSLKGWPLPFDLMIASPGGDVIAAGGDEIM